MRFRAAKWLTMAVLSMAALGMASTEAHACCGLFNCLFGWCGGGCGSCNRGVGYGPSMGACGTGGCNSGACSAGSCSTGSYYGPTGWNWSSASGSNCSSCGELANAGCSSGNCSVGPSGNAPLEPIPESEKLNENWQDKNKKTYADEPQKTGASSRPRTGSDSGLNKTGGKPDPQFGDDQGYQPVKAEDDAETDATANDSGTGAAGSGASRKARKVPHLPQIDEKDSNVRKAPTISVDDKVAWRSAPIRKRLAIGPSDAKARLVRLPAYPKSDWLPADRDSKVARK